MASRNEIEAAAARPMQFFSHDSDASQDIKCKRLLKRFGMEGYGRWWRLCELLAATDGHRIQLQEEEDAEILASELLFDDLGECMLFLEQLHEIGLLVMPGDGSLYSESMNRRSLYFGRRRVAGSKGGSSIRKEGDKQRLSNA